jgi:hypothetical protein
MYASGVPLGYMVDRRGPHLNTVLGSFALAMGYYPLLWGELSCLSRREP